MKKLTGCDWCQTSGRGNAPYNTEDIQFEKKQYGTAQFEEAYDMHDMINGYKVCTILRKPRNKALDKDTIQVKFCNQFLYEHPEVSAWVYYTDIAHARHKHISRIDVFCDLQVMANGEDPQIFMHKLDNFIYIKKGSKKAHTVYCMNEVPIEGTDKVKRVKEIESMRWGSRSGDYCVYMYNKSKELAEKEYKPWIVKAWKAAGFDLSKPVYRIEFSLHQKQIRMLEKRTGKKFRLDITHIKSQEMFAYIFQAAKERWFDIRVNDGQKKVSRMKKVDVVDDMFSPLMIVTESPKPTTNRTDKIVLKKMWQTISNLSLTDEAEINLMEEAVYIYAKQKDLLDFFYQSVKAYKHQFRRA